MFCLSIWPQIHEPYSKQSWEVITYFFPFIVEFEFLTAVKMTRSLFIFLDCDVLWTCKKTPLFLKNMLPASSGLKNITDFRFREKYVIFFRQNKFRGPQPAIKSFPNSGICSGAEHGHPVSKSYARIGPFLCRFARGCAVRVATKRRRWYNHFFFGKVYF